MARRDLIVDKFGARVRKTGQRFQIFHAREKTKKEYPAREVDKILLARPSSISSGAVALAKEYNVDIFYLDRYGKPYASIYASKLGGHVLVKKKQAEASHSEEALLLAKQFVRGKCTSQLNYLGHLAKTLVYDFSKAIAQSKAILESLKFISGNIDQTRGQLLGIEGYVADKYFAALSQIFPFPGRQYRSQDPFNIMLNYGYGILYTEIEKACLIAGLDPYTGLYHTERYGKRALVYDLAEEFRVPIVDSAIVPLFYERKVNKEDLEGVTAAKLLSKTGRVKAINAIFKKFNQEIFFGKRRWKLDKIIDLQARNLAGFLVGKRQSYFSLKFNDF